MRVSGSILSTPVVLTSSGNVWVGSNDNVKIELLTSDSNTIPVGLALDAVGSGPVNTVNVNRPIFCVACRFMSRNPSVDRTRSGRFQIGGDLLFTSYYSAASTPKGDNGVPILSRQNPGRSRPGFPIPPTLYAHVAFRMLSVPTATSLGLSDATVSSLALIFHEIPFDPSEAGNKYPAGGDIKLGLVPSEPPTWAIGTQPNVGSGVGNIQYEPGYGPLSNGSYASPNPSTLPAPVAGEFWFDASQFFLDLAHGNAGGIILPVAPNASYLVSHILGSGDTSDTTKRPECYVSWTETLAPPLPPTVVTPTSTTITLTPSNSSAAWWTNVYSYTPKIYPSGAVSDRIRVGGFGDLYIGGLKFALNGINGPVSKALLRLYVLSDDGTTTAVRVARITTAWTQGATLVAWSNLPKSTDILTIPAPVRGTWVSIDITTTLNGWISGAFPNYGLLFLPVRNQNNYTTFADGTYADTNCRPQLVISSGASIPNGTTSATSSAVPIAVAPQITAPRLVHDLPLALNENAGVAFTFSWGIANENLLQLLHDNLVVAQWQSPAVIPSSWTLPSPTISDSGVWWLQASNSAGQIVTTRCSVTVLTGEKMTTVLPSISGSGLPGGGSSSSLATISSPTNPTPVNGTTVSTPNILFDWKQPGAVKWAFSIDGKTLAGNIPIPSFTVSNLGNGTHTWAVAGFDAAGREVDVQWNFKIAAPTSSPTTVAIYKSPTINAGSFVYNGQRFYVQVAQTSTTSADLWVTAQSSVITIADRKYATVKTSLMRAADFSKTWVCSVSNKISTVQTFTGCGTAVGTAACMIADPETWGSLTPVCEVGIEYTANKGLNDCIQGISGTIASALNSAKIFDLASLQSQMLTGDLIGAFQSAIDYACVSADTPK